MVDHYRQQLDNMMQREITRADFLKFMGIALLGLFGVIGFLKNLHEIVPAQKTAKHRIAAGYGHSAYGR